MIQIVGKKSVNILDIFLIISTCAESMFNFQTVYKLILQLLCSQAKLLKDCVAIATSFSLSMFLLLYMTVKNGEKEKKKVKYPVVYTNYHLYVVYIGKLRRGFQILFNTYWCVNRNVYGMFIVRETQTSIVTFIPLNFLLFIYSFYLAFLVNNEVQIVNCFIIPFFIV